MKIWDLKSTLPTRSSYRQPLALLGALSVAIALGGCSTLVPEPLQAPEITSAVQLDRQRLAQDVEPLTGPLTLEEAIARALKHNAERRLRTLEETVASSTFELGNYDMLPKAIANAGYRTRNSDLITNSRDSVTGAPSLANPSLSSSRDSTTIDLSFSWSLLDFGQSYYAAKQNADRVLIAQERRRKSQHNLIQEVRTQYWRVVAAQALRDSIRKTIEDAEAALGDARKEEQELIRNPLNPLRFQLQVLENLKLLESIEQELSTAHFELSALIKVPFGQAITAVEPEASVARAWLDIPVTQLEEQALFRNADMREGLYNTRIAQQETRRALLKMFPGLSFNYAVKTSDDPFLINQRWNEAGAQLSFNLLGILSAPSSMRLAEAGVAVADQRRLVTQLAVLTQLHIARLQYANSLRQFDRTDAIYNVEQRIGKHVANQEEAKSQSKLDRVARQTSTILAQLRRYQSLSNAHSAGSRLQATLGLEPVVDGSDSLPVPELTATISVALKAWDAGVLPPLPVSSPSAPAVVKP